MEKGEASWTDGGRGGRWVDVTQIFLLKSKTPYFQPKNPLKSPKKCQKITQEAPLRRNSWGVFISLSQCKVNLLAGLGWDLKFAQFSGSKMSSLGSCERVDLQSKCLFGSGSQSSDFLVRVSFAR